MYWHVQHDDHVFSGEQIILLANDEDHAKQIVDRHNAELDRLMAEIRKFDGVASMPIIDGQFVAPHQHIAAFMQRKRTGSADLQDAVDSLTSYLLDNTDETFEEDAEIDDARTAILERLEGHS